LGRRKLGTVGTPLDGVAVTIGENSEILVKGPNVMRGYLHKPEETALAVDDNGWFHTGDQGKFDDDGNLIITGRIKELIVTSYGKKVATAPIEAMIMKSRYVSQAMLYGDNKKYLVALIIPDRESIENHAVKNDITFETYPELLTRNEIQALIRNEIEQTTGHLAPYEKVKAFVLISEEFTVANGFLTPSLKLRKNRIIEKYQNEIKALYNPA
jgi:long-chain acyl-CoA synthetase